MFTAANDNEASAPLTADAHAMRALIGAAANDFLPLAADEAAEAEADTDQKAH